MRKKTMTCLPYKIEAHVCRDGRIRKYPSLFCSICKPGEQFEVVMDEEEIDELNAKLKKKNE